MCKVTAQPSVDKWLIGKSSINDYARAKLIFAVNKNSNNLGTASLDEKSPILATGHQPWLWHPGILAKDITAKQVAAKQGAKTLHLIVDQDVHPALSIELPVKQNDYLDIYHLSLGNQNPAIPVGFQPPADTKKIIESLKNAKAIKTLAIDSAAVDRLISAFVNLPNCATLAEQFALVLHRLKKPYAGAIPIVFTSDIAGMQEFKNFVNSLLFDARRSVKIYNQAVHAYPQAGMSYLTIEPDRVELPLWACAWKQPRQKVYADLADSKPILTFEDGLEIDQGKMTILPRALAMTAFVRVFIVDFFIHGKGGGVYDQITELWWKNWNGQNLAPQAVATTDLFLDFNAPVADKNELAKAKWYKHWIAHNIDRETSSTCKPSLVKEKTALINQMDDDRNKPRRSAAFKRIKQINRELAKNNPNLITKANDRLNSAIKGTKNLAIAKKRDWCFALYRDDKLERLGNIH